MTASRIGGVERAGRLVGQEQLAAADHRPGDGDPLALTSRELVGVVRRPVRQSEFVEGSSSAAAWALRADTPSSSRGSETFSTALSPASRL